MDEEQVLDADLRAIIPTFRTARLFLDGKKWEIRTATKLPTTVKCRPRGGFVYVVERKERVGLPLFSPKNSWGKFTHKGILYLLLQPDKETSVNRERKDENKTFVVGGNGAVAGWSHGVGHRTDRKDSGLSRS